MTSGLRAGGNVAAGESDLAGLLARVARRDEAAFAALYRLTAGRLNGVVMRILPADTAAEALQDAYVRVWERAGDFDPARRLGARLDGDHRPQPRARRGAPATPGVARRHARRLRA